MSRYCIIGRHGLIGSALAKRYPEASSFPIPGETRVVFNFGSYAHPKFELSPEYLTQDVMHRTRTLLEWCRLHAALYVYPSSALVYEKDTAFARLKKRIEYEAEWGVGDGPEVMGLRIFPTYGGAQDTTVIGRWARAAVRGETIQVYGDGEQSRDFIHVDDVVRQIAYAVAEHPHGVSMYDIGTCVLTRFSEIIAMLGRQLSGLPVNVQRLTPPSGYTAGAGIRAGHVDAPVPCAHRVSVEVGVARAIEREIRGA